MHTIHPLSKPESLDDNQWNTLVAILKAHTGETLFKEGLNETDFRTGAFCNHSWQDAIKMVKNFLEEQEIPWYVRAADIEALDKIGPPDVQKYSNWGSKVIKYFEPVSFTADRYILKECIEEVTNEFLLAAESYAQTYPGYNFNYTSGHGFTPLSLESATKSLQWDKNTGLPYITSKASDAMIYEYETRAYEILTLSELTPECFGSQINPFVLFKRVQTGKPSKMRPVWGEDKTATIIGTMFSRPILEFMKTMDQYSSLRGRSVVTSNIKRYMNVSENLKPGESLFFHTAQGDDTAIIWNDELISLDYSNYDTSIQSDAFEAVKTVLKGLFWFTKTDVDGFGVDVHTMIDLYFHHLENTGIYTPNGLIEGKHGLPSGCASTTIIGSIWNRICAKYYRKRANSNVPTQDEIQQYASELGMVVHPTKSTRCKISDEDARISFAGVDVWVNTGSFYSIGKMMSYLLFVKDQSDYSYNKTIDAQLQRLMEVKDHPSFVNFVKLFIQEERSCLDLSQAPEHHSFYRNSELVESAYDSVLINLIKFYRKELKLHSSRQLQNEAVWKTLRNKESAERDKQAAIRRKEAAAKSEKEKSEAKLRKAKNKEENSKVGVSRPQLSRDEIIASHKKEVSRLELELSKIKTDSPSKQEKHILSTNPVRIEKLKQKINNLMKPLTQPKLKAKAVKADKPQLPKISFLKAKVNEYNYSAKLIQEQLKALKTLVTTSLSKDTKGSVIGLSNSISRKLDKLHSLESTLSDKIRDLALSVILRRDKGTTYTIDYSLFEEIAYQEPGIPIDIRVFHNLGLNLHIFVGSLEYDLNCIQELIPPTFIKNLDRRVEDEVKEV